MVTTAVENIHIKGFRGVHGLCIPIWRPWPPHQYWIWRPKKDFCSLHLTTTIFLTAISQYPCEMIWTSDEQMNHFFFAFKRQKFISQNTHRQTFTQNACARKIKFGHALCQIPLLPRTTYTSHAHRSSDFCTVEVGLAVVAGLRALHYKALQGATNSLCCDTTNSYPPLSNSVCRHVWSNAAVGHTAVLYEHWYRIALGAFRRDLALYCTIPQKKGQAT